MRFAGSSGKSVSQTARRALEEEYRPFALLVSGKAWGLGLECGKAGRQRKSGVSESGIKTLSFALLIALILYVAGSGGV